MLFNSIEFLFFLPITFLLYWFVFRSLKLQNLFIVIASYIFYGWWNWKFLILIAFTTFCSFLSGILLEKSEHSRKIQKLISMGNILLNLSILCIFKYYNFFRENLEILLQSFGIELDWVTIEVILPVGISFYTFQALSYTIDVYQHKLKASHDIISFFAFISFFPQLVAGPIERATHLLPQFEKNRSFNYPMAVDGMRQILWGLFKKVVVADNCAEIVNMIFGNYQSFDGPYLLMGAIFFSFQIYGDFSGYSDIAIGTARLFGIDLMRNFNFPYFSRDVAEFWRRWHISLTTWFRDYIYFPLGGSRCSKLKTMRNTFIIFLVSGFWHGANWTFICWGAYHALLFIPLFLIGKNKKNKDIAAKGRLLPSPIELLEIISTFILIVIGWIIFRADNVSIAYDYIWRMISDFSFTMPRHDKDPYIYILILLIVEWLNREKQFGFQLSESGIFKYRTVRWLVYYIVFIATFLLAGNQQDFIYFQF